MTLPAIFLGHGSPMNAIDPASRYNRAFLQTAAAIAKPQAILMISAHWIGRDLRIMSGVHNPILYDFHGFPAALYEAQYPAPGAPELAARVGELLAGYALHADPDRGLDHGAWAVLRHFYPEADVPVVQLGLNVLQPAAWHWALAEKLRPLRDEGVLIMGSGNIRTATTSMNTASPSAPPTRTSAPQIITATATKRDMYTAPAADTKPYRMATTPTTSLMATCTTRTATTATTTARSNSPDCPPHTAASAPEAAFSLLHKTLHFAPTHHRSLL